MDNNTIFEIYLGKLNFLFRFTGMSIGGKNRTRKQYLWDRFIFVFNIWWLNTELSFATLWYYQNSIEMTQFTYLFPCTILGLMATFKSFNHYFSEQKITNFIGIIKEMEEKTANNMSERNQAMKMKELNLLRIVLIVLNIFNGAMTVLFSLLPPILTLIKYLKTGTVELLMPFLDFYPFDAFDLRIYWFVYFHQIYAECICLAQVTTSDFIFYTCSTFLRVHFKLLQRDLEDVIPTRNIIGRTVTKEEVHDQIVELIRRHQHLISAANTLESINTKPTLFSFMSSSIIICLTGFNVTAISDPAFVIIFLMFLLMSLLQVFFLCLFGDRLTESSTQLSDAVYHSRWYVADHVTAKELSIIHTRAQTPCRLTAAGFAEVNLSAFMTIMSRSWSYFALLRTMYD